MVQAGVVEPGVVQAGVVQAGVVQAVVLASGQKQQQQPIIAPRPIWGSCVWFHFSTRDAISSN